MKKIMMMILMTLPEDIWRHQSRQWQRWEGGWGWWGIVRPLSNCRRGRNPGSTGDRAFPCNGQFLLLGGAVGFTFWGGLFYSAVNSNFPKCHDVRSIISIFQHLSSTSSLPEDFQLKASTKIRDPGFPKKEVRHSNGHNSSWSPDTLAVVEQYCFLAILFHLL